MCSVFTPSAKSHFMTFVSSPSKRGRSIDNNPVCKKSVIDYT